MRKVVVLLTALAVVACASPSGSTAPATPAGPATIKVAAVAKLGQVLVDGSDRTVYLFQKDTGTTSTCYGDCAAYWPPLLTNGAPQAGAGASASLLGTTKRSDGTVEVTYGGHPMYYVVTDHNPGDATGQGVNNFGALWNVVGPDGRPIG